MCNLNILGDVYTKVLEAAHPLHRGPTDHKRSVGPLLSLPEVHNQLFSFVHIQREIVAIFAVNVCKGRVQDLRDSIIS